MIEASEKVPPKIISEEDMPLDEKNSELPSKIDTSLSAEINANSNMDRAKFSLGSNMLGWCIVLMFACVLLSLWKPNYELVNSAFEAFKLIVMTILGYIFGSNTTK